MVPRFAPAVFEPLARVTQNLSDRKALGDILGAA